MDKTFIAIFWLIGFLLIAPQLYISWSNTQKNNAIKQEINNKISSSLPRFDEYSQQQVQAGYVTVTGSRRKFSHQRLNSYMQRIPLQQKYLFYTWQWQGVKEATASAIGLDANAYFVNSYLVGFKPFDTDAVWKPLYTLALRKQYQLDHIQYGRQEVWQNSKQAYYHTRGDCEDHAIILTDWLISLGYKARVVLGEWNNEGHAWVVLFHNKKEYILEATSKHKPTKLSDFIYADAAVDYHPSYQFDRTGFWVNTGSKYTTAYADKKWQLKSKFTGKLKRS